MTKEKTHFSIFLDTEFTHLESNSPRLITPRLISIGLVSEDGREFYVELSDNYQLQNCSDFVVQTVLPLLEGGDARMLSAQAASRLQSWIESFGDVEVILRTDAPRYDWTLVGELFQFYGCWPANLRRKYGTVFFHTPSQASRYLAATASYWKDNGSRQHHALEDARCMLFAWKFALRKGLSGK